MKFIDEYNDPEKVRRFALNIKEITTHNYHLMEVCGGQTHSIVRHGLDQLLPDKITLLHGPGCPVCVTPIGTIDAALEIASKPDVIFCSFGDMLRVPGSEKDLLSVKAEGSDIRIVYSPMDSLKIALDNPGKEVVFFGIGFETTAPLIAAAISQASYLGRNNFSILSALVLIPPAMELILASGDCHVDGFLAAGHVCTVTGFSDYIGLTEKYHIPIVITGFEPLDIIQGIYMLVSQLESGRAEVENQYSRSVRPEGNPLALNLMSEVFSVCDRFWRGLGRIENSGLKIAEKYAGFDAECKFGMSIAQSEKANVCISGEILKGKKKPFECPAFGKECTPERPLGATMVSSEGACSAYYNYRKSGGQIIF